MQQLMLALYRCGRQTDSLRAFQWFRANLLDEVGIEPSAKTIELDRAIVLDEPELVWTGPDSIAY